MEVATWAAWHRASSAYTGDTCQTHSDSGDEITNIRQVCSHDWQKAHIIMSLLLAVEKGKSFDPARTVIPSCLYRPNAAKAKFSDNCRVAIFVETTIINWLLITHLSDCPETLWVHIPTILGNILRNNVRWQVAWRARRCWRRDRTRPPTKTTKKKGKI